MEIDADKLLENAVRDGVREAVKQKFGATYQNPLDKLLEQAIAKHGDAIHSMLHEAMSSCIGDPKFREDVATSVRSTLSRILVQRFGGELEKQVNVLKSDPATRARITVAIEDIVKSKVAV